MTATAAARSPQPESQVQSSVTELENNCARLEETHARLEKALDAAGVLSARSEGSADSEKAPTLVPLAERIRRNSNRIGSAAEAIDLLIRRMEL